MLPKQARLQPGRRILLFGLALLVALALLAALVLILVMVASSGNSGEKPVQNQAAPSFTFGIFTTNTVNLVTLTPQEAARLVLTSLQTGDYRTTDALRRPDSYVKNADETRLQEEARIGRDGKISDVQFKSEIVNGTIASISFWVKRPGFKGQSSDRQLLEQGQPDERQLVTVEMVRFDSGWKWQRVNWGPMYTGRGK